MLFLGLSWRVCGVPPEGSGAPGWQIPGGTFWAGPRGRPRQFPQNKTTHFGLQGVSEEPTSQPCVTCLLVLGPSGLGPRWPCEEVSLFCPAALPCPVLWLLPALNRAKSFCALLSSNPTGCERRSVCWEPLLPVERPAQVLL